MSGPWEKYAKASPAQADGPWQKYAATVAEPQRPGSTLAAMAVKAMAPIQARPVPAGSEASVVSQWAQRLGGDTLEMAAPPLSLEGLGRALNPNFGSYGPNRMGQEVISAGREDIERAFPNMPGRSFLPSVAGMSPQDIQTAAAFGAAIKGGQSVIKKVVPAIGKRLIGTVSPATGEQIDELYKNPAGVKNAMTREQLGASVVASQNKLAKQIASLESKANKTLSDAPTIAKEELIDLFHKIKTKFVGSGSMPISKSAKAAMRSVDDALDGIMTLNGEAEKISEAQLKDVLSQFKNLPWDDPAANVEKEIRKTLDGVLKTKNRGYAEAMVDVADRVKLQKLVEKKLSLKYDPSTGTYATDTTAGKWTPRLLEGQRPETSQALKKLADYTGNDVLNKARLTNIKEAFTGAKITGSRLVQLGRHLAGTPGAMAGALIDKAGGRISMALVDALRGAVNTIGKPLDRANAYLLLRSIQNADAANQTK
jgi:hypothetical protein